MGLKVTYPRLKILEVLQDPTCHHISAEDIYKKLIDMNQEIGLATVYRVLNQFEEVRISRYGPCRVQALSTSGG